MRRLTALASLGALVVALAGAQSIRAADYQPFHISAQTQTPIAASGWQATVQMRPGAPATTFAWAGGYLSDGTFVQSGINQPSAANGYTSTAFVWAQTPGMPSPTYIALPFAALSWIEFHAERTGASWSFWFVGPDGIRHDQLTLANGSALGAFIVEAEPWGTDFGSFVTQVFRAVKVRTGSWAVPHLVFAPSAPICGHAEIVPTPGLNLVIRPASGASCYVTLS